MSLVTLNSLSDLDKTLADAGDSRLVVIEYISYKFKTALQAQRLTGGFQLPCDLVWPSQTQCKAIAPLYQKLATEFPQVTFAKCDVDKAGPIAARYQVSAMPTFKFIKGGQQVAEVRGADGNGLRGTLQQHAGPASAGSSSTSAHGKSLLAHIDKPGLSCLNEASSHTLRDLLGNGYLESDADEQLLITMPFGQAVKIRALKFRTDASASDQAPKAIKLFNNNPNIGFDDASASAGEQTFELSDAQAKGEEAVELRYVKFQKVLSLSIFVESNQGGADETRIDAIDILGDPGEVVQSMSSLRGGHDEDE